MYHVQVSWFWFEMSLKHMSGTCLSCEMMGFWEMIRSWGFWFIKAWTYWGICNLMAHLVDRWESVSCPLFLPLSFCFLAATNGATSFYHGFFPMFCFASGPKQWKKLTVDWNPGNPEPKQTFSILRWFSLVFCHNWLTDQVLNVSWRQRGAAQPI